MGKVEKLTNGTQGGPVFVYVQDGRIIRITPMEFDDSDAASWVIKARGKEFTPPRKTTVSPFTAAMRSMIYSDNRNLYPMKRVDFDPNGNRNCTKRGESGYERISWDEAIDIVTSEIKRIKREYGAAGILSTPSSHHMWGNIGYRHSAYLRFLDFIGYTAADHNPDSWEGWHWGAMHMYGNSGRLGNPEQYDLLEDALNNTEMIVFWSSDPDATCGGVYAAHESNIRRQWLKGLGVKMVSIDPFYNHTAAMFADKWFAPRPDSGNAMACAIAFVWITEDLYDKKYIESRSLGFDKWKEYILGKEDGVPKTPEWAEKESTIPAREIRALAREWGSKKTMLAAGGIGGFGGACRSATGNEWARLMVCLAAMQGMGTPGSNIWSTTQGVPCNTDFCFPGYSEGGISGDCVNSAAGYRWVYRMHKHPISTNINTPAGQHIPRLRIPECILDGKYEWRGKGFCGSHIEAQFKKYKYPEDGYPEIQMYYRYGGSFFGTMNETNRYVKAYRTDRLPFVVNQSIWFEGEAKFADIILPACTNFERWDIGEFASCSGYIPDSYIQVNHRVISMQKKCIEPLGESKPDYDICAMMADKLGFRMPYTEGGKTDLDWVKQMFEASDLPNVISWDDFFEKGYYVVPLSENYKPTPGLRWFAEDRLKDTPDWGPHPETQEVFGKGLQTTSGLIEFESSSLKRFDPNDEERPVIPKYIPSWEGHHTTELYKKYPLQLITPHPKFSFHTFGDSKGCWTNEVKDHRVLIDDYYYWIIRINSKDAEDRGIKHHELVKAFNDRGEVILAAQVTERVPPGTVHSYEASAEYDPVGKPGESADRAGCINLVTPGRYITKKSCGQAPNSCLVEIEKY